MSIQVSREEPLIAIVCLLPEDDVHQIGVVAERLRVPVPQAMSLAVRLLAECECQGVLRQSLEDNFIIARCRQAGGLPDVYRRVHF